MDHDYFLGYWDGVADVKLATANRSTSAKKWVRRGLGAAGLAGAGILTHKLGGPSGVKQLVRTLRAPMRATVGKPLREIYKGMPGGSSKAKKLYGILKGKQISRAGRIVGAGAGAQMAGVRVKRLVEKGKLGKVPGATVEALLKERRYGKMIAGL